MLRFLAFFFLFLSSCSIFSNGNRNIYLNGRIEGDEYDVATKFPGRVIKVLCDEGDNVKKGEVLAVLDSKELDAKLKQATADYMATLSAIGVRKAEVKVYADKVRSLERKLEELRNSVNLRIKIASDNLGVAEARYNQSISNLKKAVSDYERVSKDFKRFKALYAKRVIAERKFDAMKTSFEVSRQSVNIASENVKEAKLSLSSARRSLDLARNAKNDVEATKRELSSLRQALAAKQFELKTYMHKASMARAYVDEVKAYIDDMSIVSPINGTVTQKYVEVGDVVPSGYKLFTLYNLDNLYLEGYIPEDKLGLIHLGQKAYITVDSYPNKRFKAYVSYIASNAEFTPKEVQTKEERVKEVFKVKLRLVKNSKHFLKPGMPADGYIILPSTTPP